MIKSLLFLILTIGSYVVVAQTVNPDSLNIIHVRASETDSNIDFELAKHYIFYNPTTDPKWEKSLVVYLPGSFDVPQNTVLFPTVAANKGHHVVSLKYENGIAAKTACSNSTDSDCFSKYRQEIITGEDLSDKVEVDKTNSIENRLLKLITYLSANRPNENWDLYLDNGTLVWSKIIMAGHSQGGGHAAYMGLDRPLKRALMFSAPNDWSEHYNAPAKWTTLPKATRTASYFAFGAFNDDVVDFSKQYQIWQSLGLGTITDTTLADEDGYINSDTRLMYTKFNKAGLSVNHNATVRDSDTPLDSDGMPIFKHIWEVMLGVEWILNVENPIDEDVKIYPNPASSYIYVPERWNSYVIYNLSGKELESSIIVQNQIYIEDLPKGLYYLRLKGADSKAFTKFIKD